MNKPNEISHTIIGYGALGSALVHSLSQSSQTLSSVISSRSAAIKEKVPEAYSDLTNAPLGQIVWICTPDDYIHESAAKIADIVTQRPDESGRVLLHCSGSESLEPLYKVTENIPNLSVASLHPLQTFTPKKYGDEENPFKGCYASVLAEDDETVAFVSQIAESLQLKPVRVEPMEKKQIHLSATIACNYMVSLMHAAESALPKGQSIEILKPLLKTTLDNILRSGPAQSLSGPIKRKDSNTIKQHLDILTAGDKVDLCKLYAVLGRYTNKHLLEDESSEIDRLLMNVLNETLIE